MRKPSLAVAACATLLWAGTALATPTPQQNCDKARITAWKVYQSCVDGVVAKDASGVTFDEFKAFWGCRHTYFKKWASFQTKASLAGSTCAAGLNNRFATTDSGATVTDALTGLVWELKTGGVHSGGDGYSWSTGSNAEDGTAFTTFLTTDLNAPGFAGANGWRLPTLAELQSILADFACTQGAGSPTCTCTSSACLAFSDSNETPGVYWSSTSDVRPESPFPDLAWSVVFVEGSVGFFVGGTVGGTTETLDGKVRAVRGGL